MTKTHKRSLPAPGDPRDQPPNDTEPGENEPPTTANPPGDFNPISVGPNASEGFGNAHVMYPQAGPPPPSAWAGWPVAWQTPTWNSGGGADFSGRWGALVDVVFAALDLNSSILSTMPPYLTNRGKPQPERTWMLNPEPMVYSSFAALAKEMFWSYVGTGELFLYATAKYADGYPMRFIVVNPAHVDVDRIGGRIEYRINKEPVDPTDVLHVKYVSYPGDLRGHGPLEVAGARLLAISALLRYSTTLATSGGLPPAVLKYPRRASRAQMAQMQADWVEARATNMGIPAVLAEGTDLQLITPQLQESALSELSRFSEARVSTLLGVPPFLLGLPAGDSGTYVNSTNVFDFHWRGSLRPKASAITDAMSQWLLPLGWRVDLDRDEYTRPGFLERAQGFATLVGAGILSPSEVRELERYGGQIGSLEETPAPPLPVAVAEGSVEMPTTLPKPNGRPPITNVEA